MHRELRRTFSCLTPLDHFTSHEYRLHGHHYLSHITWLELNKIPEIQEIEACERFCRIRPAVAVAGGEVGRNSAKNNNLQYISSLSTQSVSQTHSRQMDTGLTVPDVVLDRDVVKEILWLRMFKTCLIQRYHNWLLFASNNTN